MTGFEVGQRASVQRVFTREDVAAYAALTGDENAGLERVPGPLLGSMFSYLLGTTLPGRGTSYLKQRLIFLQPARLGDPITAEVEIARLRPDRQLAHLKTTCRDSSGNVVCDGEALVLIRDAQPRP